jgi:lipid II:glycine glycyltransferase (peptidoglycan interpeptide bridge formation enzyme)
MVKPEARFLTLQDYEQWDTLVDQSEQGTIFHSSRWITTVAPFLHLKPAIIGVFDESNLIGGCSFYINEVFHLYKRGLTDVDLSPYGGIILAPHKSKDVHANETKKYQIISLILEKIQELKFFSIHLKNSPGLLDVRPFTWQGWKEKIYYTYMLSLDNDTFSHVSHKVRQSIRKSRNYGMTVEKDYNPELYWQLVQSTWDKQNMKVPYQKELLFAVMEVIHNNDRGEMWIAKTPSHEAAAAVFFALDTHTVQGVDGANDPRFRETGVTSHLHFEIFLDLQKRGYHQFNFMGGNTPNLAGFFSSFNPHLVPYYEVEKTDIKNMGRMLF